jgi:hypothetical protein
MKSVQLSTMATAHFDVDEWMSYPDATRDDLGAVARLVADFPQPWFFCGGWAIDLFLGRPMRTHKDVDIGIFRADQQEIQTYLLARGWELAVAGNGVLTPWQQGVWLDLPIHTIWCRNLDHVPVFLEVLFNEGDLAQFGFRRNPALTCAGTEAIRYTVDGLPYLAPEIALLYKSRHVEEVNNQRDFDHALPQLTTEQRAWLRNGLFTLYERHAWLDRLNH